MHKLYTAAGGGGMLVEAAFAIADVPVELIDVDWNDVGWGSKTLGAMNPLGQLPTLVLPDGRVMTESAAMMLHLADLKPESGLAVPVDHPRRPEFLRWLIFLVSAVYPTFTYGDVPTRWVGGDEAAGKLLKSGTDDHRKMLYQYMEGFCGEPWFFDDTFSCIDLYFWGMRNWRPGKEWFEAECPKLNRIGLATAERPEVKAVTARNYPDAKA